MIAGFLVMFMQAGFGHGGNRPVPRKNAAHTMSMNLMILALGCLSFWAYGFAIGWGNWIARAGRAPAGARRSDQARPCL